MNEQQRAAVRQGIEALKDAGATLMEQGKSLHPGQEPVVLVETRLAITAMRQALEQQPAEEPVATLWQHGETGRTRVTMPGDITDCDASWFKAADLYTHPQPAAQWVGLTDEEMGQLVSAVWPREATPADFIRAIEAKLREKNGGGV